MISILFLHILTKKKVDTEGGSRNERKKHHGPRPNILVGYIYINMSHNKTKSQQIECYK